MKAYIFRRHDGRYEYKTKCANVWTRDKKLCWQFDFRSAEMIASRFQEHERYGFYEYGVELI